MSHTLSPLARALLAVLGLLAATLLPHGDAAPASTPSKAQHISLSAVRLPKVAIGSHWANFQEKTTGGNVGVVFNASSYALVGSVSVGSPAQSVSVWINPWAQDFGFLDAYGPESTGSAIAGRYDYTASTSATVTNQSFYGAYGAVSGNITVTDTIQFNSVAISGLTFGDANTYTDYIAQLNVAGVIGLAPSPNTFDTNLTSLFGSQLATSTSVDTPVASFSFVVPSINLNSNTLTSSGQVTVGAEDGSVCTAGTYTYVTNTGGAYYPTGFRVDSISGATPSGDSLSLTVADNRVTAIGPTYPGFYGSTDFVQLLVNASGLVDQGNGHYYEANSCDDVQNMGSLTLNLAGGSTLTLAPADYIYQNVTSDGTTKCGAYFYTYGSAETDSNTASYPIILGQPYLNNHCYAHNYADGTIGIASAVSQTTIVISGQ
jgi:hypothetical protein